MSEHKILVIGDVHLVSHGRSPGYRTETYTEDVLRKLEETVQIAKEQEASHVLFLGDIWDDKRPDRTSFRVVKEVQRILKSYEVPVSILPGNHDLQNGTLESLPKQPISMLEELANVSLLQWDKLSLDSNAALYPVPGVPLSRDVVDGREEWLDKFVTGGQETRRIIVAHQLIVPNLDSVPPAARRSFYSAPEIALHTDAHMVLYGDVHSNHGFHKHKGQDGRDVVFVNLGSICRMSANDVDHVPEVYTLTIRDDEERSISAERFVLKSVRPASEVYRLEERYEAKEHQADIDETIKRLVSTTIHRFSIDAVAEELKVNESVTPPVRNKAVELIEAVR